MFKTKLKIFAVSVLTVFCILLLFVSINSVNSFEQKAVAENVLSEKDAAIENALYARTEFFGASAIVPYPTEEARERLSKILENHRDEPEIYLKLSELDEKLENFREAENELQKYIELQSDKISALKISASFYNRRGEFEKQAKILSKLLNLASKEKRGEYFSDLINFAKTHKLEEYLRVEFYQKIIAQDASAFSILEQYLDKLIEEKNYEEALKFSRESKKSFPEKSEYFIQKEVSILVAQNKKSEAENVYYQAFEPSWSDELTEQFYTFLSENDRFKIYGTELKKKFKQNSTDFDAAIRLIHYQKYDGDASKNVILKLENARAAQKIEWKADELLAVSLFLISEGNADSASRFLYTLFLKQEARARGKLRAKILYQLFALLCDAENDRIALTKGGLNFYRDIASSDTNPGITTGILSLIFADENPQSELAEKEKNAVKLFNRAAAYRIFSEYKKEFPQNPELAQMYLDVVRLYTAEKDFEIAETTLAEFEERFKDSANYPLVALKLADAYTVAGKTEKEREIYQKVLDYFGSQRDAKNPLIVEFEREELNAESSDNSDVSQLNKGINIPSEKDESSSEFYYSEPKTYTNFISPKPPQITYEFVLNRFVSSLARDKKTQEILALYNREINKYADEQGLYEDFLIWLGQTNFAGEQLEVYKRALGKFQNKTWQDKLARWYIKNQRKEEFSELSRDLIEKFSDAETQDYLWNFIDDATLANPEGLEGKLYFALYQKAHERFPHNRSFVSGLLKYYLATERKDEWQKLMAEYYFEMPEIRQDFLTDLSKRDELRQYFFQAGEKIKDENSIEALPYRLFRADAAANLSNFEESIAAYRQLNRLYPNTSEFSERLINFTRSFGQTNRKFLAESAEITHNQAQFLPASFDNRTRAGELRAELGDYEAAKDEWQKLILTAKGDPQTYLNAATIFWDYFQYDDALNILKSLRAEMRDDALYAFQMGAIYEAKRDQQNAVREYIKQLGVKTSDQEVLLDTSRTKKRLAQLSARENLNEQIKAVFENESVRQPKNSTLILNYAHFLVKTKQNSEAIYLLNEEVARSNSEDFLLEAKMHYENLEDESGERLTLQRLAQTAQTKKRAIAYQLQLAEDLSESGEKQRTMEILKHLVENYPTNYGVLSEADEFYWRIGSRENSLRVLQNGANLGRGNFKYIFKRKLASRLISLDRTRDAEKTLLSLYVEDKSDTEVFDELANIYVRENDLKGLRKIASETIETLKKQDLESRELNDATADWRRRLINSYTRLKDYDSAIEQHIEIINRQPDDEQNVEEAIKYVRRYGGAEKLLGFYQNLADEAYKNYRWTLVLARIHEANKDFAESIENYKLAIHNQPEMVELYVSLTDVYAEDQQFDAAIATIDKVLELTHDTPNYLKRKIEILEQAGRVPEAEIVREKLTGIRKPERGNSREEFAEAARLSEIEIAKAIEIYRQAFNEISENPLDSDLKSADVVGYVRAVRREDSLDEIAGRLWNLREKLIAEIENQNNADVGKTRNMLATLDGAFPEAVGQVAVETATGNELDALFRDIKNRIKESKNESDKYHTFALLQNLIERCGFAQLKEQGLIARKDAAFGTDNFHNQLYSLLNYYEEKGNFERELEILESETKRDVGRDNFSYQEKIADVSKLLNDREKELQALRNHFDAPENEVSVEDEYVGRYLEMLYSNGENGRAELETLAKSSDKHQLQVINFFITKNEKELAHAAIGNASRAEIWKRSKNAETALALSEFEDEKADYFISALQFASIGELIKPKSGDQINLGRDEWFRLTYKYGNWLKLKPNEDRANLAEKYLPAMTENRPSDANEQLNLGVFYLRNKDFSRALEHLKIAREMHPGDKKIWANLGTAYFQTGETAEADELWSEIIADEYRSLEDCELYFETLHAYGQAAKARENLMPIISKLIRETTDDNPSAALLIFLWKMSDSIGEESEKTKFWLELSNAAPEKTFIPKYVVERSLVAEDQIKKFYQILIERSAGADSWSNDDEFVRLLEMNWDFGEAEAILDQEKNFEIEEPENERLNWQRQFLSSLLERRDFGAAKSLILEIKQPLQKTHARPVWLRIAEFQFETKDKVSLETFQKMKSFIGIADVTDAKQLNSPKLERLNEIIKLLKARSFDAEVSDLNEAFYARLLALQKYNLSNFSGLAEVEFQRGENKLALDLLNLMTQISFEESREIALKQLSSLNVIEEFSPKNPELFEITEENNLDKNSALKLAAEIAAKFGEIDSAINYRQKLFTVAPENQTNKIELARLFAHKQNFEEAVKHLSSVISGRNTTRNARWQAVFVAGEIIKDDDNLWKKLRENLPDLKAKDSEMSNALEALASVKNGNAVEAIRLFDNSEFQSPQSFFLKGIIAENSGEYKIALKYIY